MFNSFKKIVVGIVLIAGLAGIPHTVSAQSYYGLDEAVKKTGYDTEATIESSVDRVVSTLLALLSIIFFILVTYAGFRWMTARGNEEMATSAKETLEASAIGLLIVLSAYAVTSFLFSRLEGVTDAVPAPPVQGCEALSQGACVGGCRWSRVTSKCKAADGGCSDYSIDAQLCESVDNCFWEGTETAGECKNTNSIQEPSQGTTGACWSVSGAGINTVIQCDATTRDACGAGKQFEPSTILDAQAFCRTRQSEAAGLNGTNLPCRQKTAAQCNIDLQKCVYMNNNNSIPFTGCVNRSAVGPCQDTWGTACLQPCTATFNQCDTDCGYQTSGSCIETCRRNLSTCQSVCRTSEAACYNSSTN